MSGGAGDFAAAPDRLQGRSIPSARRIVDGVFQRLEISKEKLAYAEVRRNFNRFLRETVSEA